MNSNKKLVKQFCRGHFSGKGGGIFLGVIFPGDNFPGGDFHGGHISGGKFSGGLFSGGLLSRGHFSGHPIEDISEIHLRHEATVSDFGVSDFGVSTAILNTIDISRGWCKLNFGPLQGQVKACHFC